MNSVKLNQAVAIIYLAVALVQIPADDGGPAVVCETGLRIALICGFCDMDMVYYVL